MTPGHQTSLDHEARHEVMMVKTTRACFHLSLLGVLGGAASSDEL
jgi:hypothetical protein